MKISEYKNEDALDLLADILEPTAKILADKDVQNAIKKKSKKITVVKHILKNRQSEIIEILARLQGVDKKDYSANPVEMFQELTELLNDEELMDFFQSQGQMAAQKSSISATENIEAKGQ